MGKDSGGNRKKGRAGAGAGAAPQQAAPQQQSTMPAKPVTAPAQPLSPAAVKIKAAEENGVKLSGTATSTASLYAGQQVFVKKTPSNIPAGPDPWRLRDAGTGQILASAKSSANLLAFANAMALTVVPEK